MGFPFFKMTFSAAHVADIVRLHYQGRVVLHEGDREIAPGISLHLIGGHTLGQQVVRVSTRRGALVIASDAAHFYGNFETGHPFFIAHNFETTFRGYARLKELATSPSHVIPGPRSRRDAALSGLGTRLRRLRRPGGR